MGNTKISDVVIIGGGLSGLVAAHDIQHFSPNLEVLVLEANDDVGGRIRSEKVVFPGEEKLNVSLDMGAQYLHVECKNVLQLLDQLNIQTHPVRVKPPIIKSDEIWPLWGKSEFYRTVVKLDKLAAQIDPRFPYRDQMFAEKFDNMTVHSYIKSECVFQTTREQFDFKLKTILGRDSSCVSMLSLLSMAHSVGGFFNIFEWSNELLSITGGAKIICDRLANKIGRSRIITDQSITNITAAFDGSDTLVTSSTNQMYKCKLVICTVPLNLVSKIEFHPPLNPKMMFTVNNYIGGNMSKFFVIYKTKFWETADDYSGLDFNGGSICDTRINSKLQILSVSDCSVNANQGVIVGFICGTESIEACQFNKETLKMNILEKLTQIGGDPRFMDNQHFYIKHWSDELYCGSPAPFPSVGSMRYNETLRFINGKVIFAGAETATEWTGHMSGAVQSGQRAALQVLQDLRPQSLSTRDFARMANWCINPDVISDMRSENQTALKKNSSSGKWSVYRWTFILPVAGLAVAFFATSLREKYGKLLFPMPG